MVFMRILGFIAAMLAISMPWVLVATSNPVKATPHTSTNIETTPEIVKNKSQRATTS